MLTRNFIYYIKISLMRDNTYENTHFYLAYHTLLIKENSAPHKDKQLLN